MRRSDESIMNCADCGLPGSAHPPATPTSGATHTSGNHQARHMSSAAAAPDQLHSLAVPLAGKTSLTCVLPWSG
jgi:hypothetical protein